MTVIAKGIDVIQTTVGGATEIVFRASLKTSAGLEVTEASNINLRIFAVGDSSPWTQFDFATWAFSTSAPSIAYIPMTLVSAPDSSNTGLYFYKLTTLTGFTNGGTYVAKVTDANVSPAAMPVSQEREFQFGSAQGDLVVTSAGNLEVDVRTTNGLPTPFPSRQDVYVVSGCTGSYTGANGTYFPTSYIFNNMPCWAIGGASYLLWYDVNGKLNLSATPQQGGTATGAYWIGAFTWMNSPAGMTLSANGGATGTAVVSLASANAGQIGGVSPTMGTSLTFPTSIASPTNITAASGVSLAANQAVNTTQWGGTAVTGMPMPTYSQPSGFLAAAFGAQVGGSAQLTGDAYGQAVANNTILVNATYGLSALHTGIAAIPTTAAPTASQVATAVFQDATVGDFAVAHSFGSMVANIGSGTVAFTSNAMANAPTGGGATAQAIATAILTDTTSTDFTTAASPGYWLKNYLNASIAALGTPQQSGSAVTLGSTDETNLTNAAASSASALAVLNNGTSGEAAIYGLLTNATYGLSALNTGITNTATAMLTGLVDVLSYACTGNGAIGGYNVLGTYNFTGSTYNNAPVYVNAFEGMYLWLGPTHQWVISRVAPQSTLPASYMIGSSLNGYQLASVTFSPGGSGATGSATFSLAAPFSATYYVGTFASGVLANAPSGGSGGATASQIATAVWTDATEGDLNVAGTPGYQVMNGGSGGSTNASVFTGAFPESVLANAPTGTTYNLNGTVAIGGITPLPLIVQQYAGVNLTIPVTTNVTGHTVKFAVTSMTNRSVILWEYTAAVNSGGMSVTVTGDDTNTQSAPANGWYWYAFDTTAQQRVGEGPLTLDPGPLVT